MPPTSPRRRPTSGIRRPRVAGRAPEGTAADAATASVAVDERTAGGEARSDRTTTRPREDRARDDHSEDRPGRPETRAGRRARNQAAGQDAAERPTVADPVLEDSGSEDSDAGTASPARASTGLSGARRLHLPAGPRTKRGTVVLAAVTLVLALVAVAAGVSWYQMRHTPAAQNSALTDVAATAQVSQQLGDAVKTVYSYDFNRLDENERAARDVITPEFAAQFDQLFGQVRQLAPQQQAVVTATIAQSAVREIAGDRAVVLVFLDQQATRAASGDQPQQLAAAGRLTVTGQLVDGRWRIAAVQAA
jgi:Mce-associated membrane protein